MMGMTVFDVLKKEIREQRQQASEHLSSGRAKDYAEYREVCGLLRGLGFALEEIEKAFSETMEDDDYE